jgi:Fibronectin type III domain
VQLTWTAPASTGGSAIGDYVLEWSLDSATWTRVADGVSVATGFTVGGLSNGTTYSFRVAAVNAAGTGSWSDVVAATPLGAPVAPGGVTAAVAPTAAVGSGQVKLSWAGPADDGGRATVDYVVQRSVDGTVWTTVNDGVSTARTYPVGGLTNGTRYRFRIAARNAIGQGPWSAIVQATPRWKPAAPGGVRAAVAPAAGVGSRQVKLTWTAPSNNGAAITDYFIQRSTNGTTWNTVADGVSTARSHLVSRLTNGVQYRFRIAARNLVGQGPWSAVVRATPHAR